MECSSRTDRAGVPDKSQAPARSSGLDRPCWGAEVDMFNTLLHPRTLMVARCAISILVLSALGVPWALEQPSSSVLEFHPAMQFIAKKFSVHKVWVLRQTKGS